MRSIKYVALSIVLVASAACWAPALAQDEAAPAKPRVIKSCYDDPNYGLLDFWLGGWDVRVGTKLVGQNVIEKTLRGCAVIEKWTSREGGDGMSLFWYDAVADTWKQVWITDAAYSQGGLKQKSLVRKRDDGALVFEGEIATPGGGSYLDRTLLIPQRDGTVRQIIEISTDVGNTWVETFDAIYVRTAPAAQGVWRRKP